MDRDDIIQLVKELIKDGITIEMDSDYDYEGDKTYVTVRTKVLYNNELIASDSTSFRA